MLDRAFSTLEILSDGKPKNLAGLSAAFALDTSTTFRLRSTLQSHRYAARHRVNEEGSSGIACVALAQACLSQSILSVGMPHLVALRDLTRETVHLAFLHDINVVYVDQHKGLYAFGIMPPRVGGRAPAYGTGVVKALLANQDPEEVRSRYETHHLHRFIDSTLAKVGDLMADLAVVRRRDVRRRYARGRTSFAWRRPPWNASGAAVAALSVSGPKGRMDLLPEQTELMQQTQATAEAVSRSLSGVAPSQCVSFVNHIEDSTGSRKPNE